MRNRYALAAVAAVVALCAASAAFATPNPNGAFLSTYVFNNCPFSTLTQVNNYPAQIVFDDEDQGCNGFANRNAWSFSDDGGATAAVFNNNAAFKFRAEVNLSGNADIEGGLRLSPWYSKYVDGVFMLNGNGEIACFGGRLPFYQFFPSGPGGYVKGTTAVLEMTYLPRGLTMASPAIIEYRLIYNANLYTSGALPFDQGNPAEDPPYGLWGMLNDGRAGGYSQHIYIVDRGQEIERTRAEWADIKFENLDVVDAENTSWGKVKGMYR